MAVYSLRSALRFRRGHRARSVLTAAATAAMLLPIASAAAQAPAEPLARHAGRFVRDSAASDDVRAAIESAVARMNFLTRPIGRSRLRATNQPPAEVELAFPADSVVIRYAGQPDVRAGRSGAAFPWRNAAGEEVTLRVTVTSSPDGGVSVVQVFEAEDGQRENRWRLEAKSDVLRLDVLVTSPRLPEPLRYRQVFRRVQPKQGVEAATPIRGQRLGCIHGSLVARASVAGQCPSADLSPHVA